MDRGPDSPFSGRWHGFVLGGEGHSYSWGGTAIVGFI